METLKLLVGLNALLWNRFLNALGVRKPRDGWRRAAGVALRGEEATFVLSAFGLKASEEVLRSRLSHLLDGDTNYHILIRPSDFEDHPIVHSSATFTFRSEKWCDGLGRFIRPDSWHGEIQGMGLADTGSKCLLNFVARSNEQATTDLWMRVNHVGLDGMLAQTLLTKLAADLGQVDVFYPSFREFRSVAIPKVVAGRPNAIEVQAFIDLTPLLEWRRQQIEQLGENMTLSAAVLWWLAKHQVFRKLRMGTTVDIEATGDFGRGVGVVVVRPKGFINKSNGLARFVRKFNRQLEQTRQRRSDTIKTLNAAAAIPAELERLVLNSALKSTRAFGALGLTMLRDASVFGAPIGEIGHDHGFIAIGSVLLPTESGEQVASITVKGTKGIIDNYPSLLYEALYEGPSNAIAK